MHTFERHRSMQWVIITESVILIFRYERLPHNVWRLAAVSSRSLLAPATAAELQDHVDCATRLDIVVAQQAFVAHLLPTVDETDLLHLDTLLLLQGLFDLSHCVVQLEVEVRLPACEGLDENLHPYGSEPTG
eukprot:TRINITY_DN92470_c0_g1_i1.p1 TRINITY_DN92470_c0_g1~~TRINITY_DN92470_c0_g1_i1.p1  ORF type:complete len:132 (-),score=4.54 TRINITY_DN92470_c0_g1_i1:71-466(-)